MMADLSFPPEGEPIPDADVPLDDVADESDDDVTVAA